MAVRFLNPLAAVLVLTAPMRAQVLRNGVPTGQIVIIQGRVTGSKSQWATYQNGVFSRDAYVNDFFKVPDKKTLVVVEADLNVAGDARKVVNVDLVVSQGRFPLAHASFHNDTGASHFTATRTFALGLVVPSRSASGQQGLLNLLIHDPLPSATYEVLLHGYYTD